MKYMKFVNGKGLQVVKDVDEACDDFTANIKELFHAEKARNDRLQAENQKLKDEHYENEVIQEQENRIAELRSQLGFSFRLTKSDWDAIHAWQNEHMADFTMAKQGMDKLVNDINAIIGMCCDGEDPDTCEISACTGSCATCGGCH